MHPILTFLKSRVLPKQRITTSPRQKLALAALLLWLFGSQLYLAKTISTTTDEHVHIASGYMALTRHNFRFDADHPPLAKYLFALPVLLAHPNLPPGGEQLWDEAAPTVNDSWIDSREWADRWWYATPGNDPQHLIFLGRLAAVLITTALGLSLYLLGKRIHPPQLGLFTLFFAATNPLLLGHGYLANTDVPLVFSATLAIHALITFWEKRTLRSAVWVGLATALVLTTKTSGLGMLAPIGLTLIAFAWRRPFKTWAPHVALAILSAWIGIWAVYQFRSPFVPWPDITKAWGYNDPNYAPYIHYYRDVEAIAPKIRLILPMDYSKSVLMLVINGQFPRKFTYLLGENQVSHLYYPVAYAVKTPIAISLITLFGLVGWWGMALRRRPFRVPVGITLLIITSGVYTVSALLSKLQIGLRHAMVPIILSSFIAAWFMVKAYTKPNLRPLATILLIIGCVLPTVASFPYYLGYIDPLFLKLKPKWYYLADSNVDWGQQSGEVADLLKQHFPDQPVAANWLWSPYQLQAEGLTVVDLDPENPPANMPVLVTSQQLSTRVEYLRYRSIEPVLKTGDDSAFIYYFGSVR